LVEDLDDRARAIMAADEDAGRPISDEYDALFLDTRAVAAVEWARHHDARTAAMECLYEAVHATSLEDVRRWAKA
jgi:hypothetical protein